MVGGTGYRAATSSDSLTKHKNRHGRVRSQISHHGQLTCTFPLQRSVTIATVGLHEPRAYNPPSGTRGCQPNNQTSLPTKKVVATNTDESAESNNNTNPASTILSKHNSTVDETLLLLLVNERENDVTAAWDADDDAEQEVASRM
jgi:hypothetical protein